MLASNIENLLLQTTTKGTEGNSSPSPPPVPVSSTSCKPLRVTAHNRFLLWKMGITHVLNAAHGKMFCQGGHDFYGTSIDYYGVPASDLPDFDMSKYFFPASEYIQKALSIPEAKILVHCAVGISRSASLVLAYLMIHHRLSLVEAIKTVKKHRVISPNRGFLKQLQNLDIQLRHRKNS
uniref:Dual specificity protein phosphatase n=1 Tax=Geotrypetes seraphini TaxID=260995 RepID=A0A6P8QCT9_GEOSA|nr:dual specificity protein phosphatase 13 isoform X2 [Geotrypetes seraphini]